MENCTASRKLIFTFSSFLVRIARYTIHTHVLLDSPPVHLGTILCSPPHLARLARSNHLASFNPTIYLIPLHLFGSRTVAKASEKISPPAVCSSSVRHSSLSVVPLPRRPLLPSSFYVFAVWCSFSLARSPSTIVFVVVFTMHIL